MTPTSNTPPPLPPGASPSSTADNKLVIIALVVPILIALALMFVQIDSFILGACIGLAMVIFTSILVATDARRVGYHPALPGLLLLWAVFFPIAMFRRAKVQRPNLGPLAIVVALFFMVGPIGRDLLFPRAAVLPACDSAEVKALLEQIVAQFQLPGAAKVIREHRQITFDSTSEKRHGECVLYSSEGDFPIAYTVEWESKETARFYVRAVLKLPPPVSSTPVKNVLEQILNESTLGYKPSAIAGHRELSRDESAATRTGECTVRHEKGESKVKFLIYWSDREKAMFMVRVIE